MEIIHYKYYTQLRLRNENDYTVQKIYMFILRLHLNSVLKIQS